VAFGVVLLGALVTVRSHTAIGDQAPVVALPRRSERLFSRQTSAFCKSRVVRV